jgi:hypothetical protein
MSLTKANARSLIRQIIDDPNATLWTNANLDQLAELAIDEMWGDLLSWSPWLTSQLDTITSLTSPGFMDLRITGSGGALSKRFHRLQSVVRGGTTFTKYDPRDTIVELNAEVYAPQDSYIFLGDQLWLFPLDTTTDVEIRYSFKPTAFGSLADGDAVTWPDGHDLAYVYEIASSAIVKGDREDNNKISRIADRSWNRLLDAVRKRQIGPIVPWTPDSPHEFGGI